MDTIKGCNLPKFQSAQIEFAAYIRNPEVNSAPADIDPRRMEIYAGLFYRNIERFLRDCFTRARLMLPDIAWHALIREFIHQHRCQSPYFLEISQEFLEFLNNEKEIHLPYLVELCHFDWVRIDLIYSPYELPPQVAYEDLQLTYLTLSPLAKPLSYEWPVKEIDQSFDLTKPPEERTWLVIYRDRHDKIQEAKSNIICHRLFELFNGTLCTCEVINMVTEEMGISGSDHRRSLEYTIERFVSKDILLVTEDGFPDQCELQKDTQIGSVHRKSEPLAAAEVSGKAALDLPNPVDL